MPLPAKPIVIIICLKQLLIIRYRNPHARNHLLIMKLSLPLRQGKVGKAIIFFRAFFGKSPPTFLIPVILVGKITFTMPRFAAPPEFIAGRGTE